MEELGHAEGLLSMFYKTFAEYYGAGPGGLNVHNTCHLVHCVMLVGPMWAWSCFAFEDANSLILHAVHGTGNVMRQILWYKNAVVRLAAICPRQLSRGKQWRSLKEAKGCYVAGAVGEVGECEEFIRTKIGVGDLPLQKAYRIFFQGEQLYSKQYGRMQKRVCFVVLIHDARICAIEYFLLNRVNQEVYAVVKVEEVVPCILSNYVGGNHLNSVRETNDVDVLPIQSIAEKLLLVSIKDDLMFVIQFLNNYCCRYWCEIVNEIWWKVYLTVGSESSVCTVQGVSNIKV